MNIHLIGSRPLSVRKVTKALQSWLPVIVLGTAVVGVGVLEYKDSNGPVHTTTAQLTGIKFEEETKKTNYGPKGTSWTSTVPARRLAVFTLSNGEAISIVVGPETFKQFEQLMATQENTATDFTATYKVGEVFKTVRDVDVQVTSARPSKPNM